MTLEVWEEIHGFSSPGEYHRFVRYIEDQVIGGQAEELPVDMDYGVGELYGGRWFRNTTSMRVWRLIAPDLPFKGLWEPLRFCSEQNNE